MELRARREMKGEQMTRLRDGKKIMEGKKYREEKVGEEMDRKICETRRH